MHGGTVHPSQMDKEFTQGLYTPPKWLNNSRRDCTVHLGGVYSRSVNYLATWEGCTIPP